MILTLCGSARFEKEFHDWNKRLTLRGHVVIALSGYPSTNDGNKNWYSPGEKITLDLVHLAKIEESDAILLLNIDDYIGESTAREVEWARIRGKRIYTVEPTLKLRDWDPADFLLGEK